MKDKVDVIWIVASCILIKFADVSEIFAASIIRAISR
jgi:hypothetical protein